MHMEIKTGYLYHIKDVYFDVVNDENLMQNHEKGKKRPTYFTIKDKDVLWFIPISSKIDKYRKIIDKKREKYGFCNTIIIRKIADEDAAILLQNAFPTLEKYIDHVHTVDGIPLKVPTDLQNEIKNLFKNMLGLKKRGTNLFFTDIDNLKQDIYALYRGKKISAFDLFEEHQITGNYCRSHYAKALRKLVSEGLLEASFIDGKNHVVTVLISKDCILNFK